MRTIAVRLHPGEDLYNRLEEVVRDQRLDAACILTCVGSLRRACLRFADQPEGRLIEDGDPDARFEIVSLTGVMTPSGSHYHISISDRQGMTIGGHLLAGCLIYTTAEIVIGVLHACSLSRQFDPETGYPELVIH